jgi:hypothetical protein
MNTPVAQEWAEAFPTVAAAVQCLEGMITAGLPDGTCLVKHMQKRAEDPTDGFNKMITDLVYTFKMMALSMPRREWSVSWDKGAVQAQLPNFKKYLAARLGLM